MVQYYYDKYNSLITSYNYNAVWSPAGESGYSVGGTGKSLSYYYDSTGKPILGGELANSNIVVGATFYYISGTSLYKAIVTEIDGIGIPTAFYWRNEGVCHTPNKTPVYGRGSLVQSNIAAEDGTYPANGRHTDGYWYVKGATVGPLPPNTVTVQQNSTVGNGGRKLTRLNNGWLVAATISSTSGLFLHVSKDKGITWSSLTRMEQSVSDVAIASVGTQVYVLASYINNTTLRFYRFDAVTVSDVNMVSSGINIDNNQQNFGNVSLAIDPINGQLHATWASKNATYNNSYNIRYGKSIDGGATWSVVEQVTKVNLTDAHFINPCIVVKNGKAYIFSSLRMGTTQYMSVAIQGLAANEGIYNPAYTNWGVHFVDKSDLAYPKVCPSAVVDKDGRFHVAWHAVGDSGVPTYNYVRYAFSDDAKSWSSVDKFNNPAFGNPTISVDKLGTLFILGDNPISNPLHQLKKIKNGSWVRTSANYGDADKLFNPSILYDPYFDVTFGEFSPVVFEVLTTPKKIKFGGSFSTNNAPSITITSPSNNQTLYENDVINISGDAYDSDKDQSVTVFYQINGEQRKVLATNVSQTQITLSKQLTFKDGKLYDGETVLTGTLTEGVAHTLKVWAVDSENGQSATIERTFYVVPNRAPLLSVDAVVPAGVVDVDKFKISGTSTDPDANANVKITKKVNANNPVEIYNGPGGAWEFDVSLAELVVGENTIVIEVIDNYGAKTSKTIKLKKNEVKTPVLHAVARYKITPPAGSAKGVLLFVERDEDMDLKVELSMTLAGEQEQYVTLTADHTAPVTAGIVEDEFYYEADEQKNNIILKLSTTRANIDMDHKIHLISGVLE